MDRLKRLVEEWRSAAKESYNTWDYSDALTRCADDIETAINAMTPPAAYAEAVEVTFPPANADGCAPLNWLAEKWRARAKSWETDYSDSETPDAIVGCAGELEAAIAITPTPVDMTGTDLLNLDTAMRAEAVKAADPAVAAAYEACADAVAAATTRQTIDELWRTLPIEATTTPPTDAGWYRWRPLPAVDWQIVFVELDEDALVATFAGVTTYRIVSTMTGEWGGRVL